MPGPFPVPAPVTAVCAFDELEMRKLSNYGLICTKVGQGGVPQRFRADKAESPEHKAERGKKLL